MSSVYQRKNNKVDFLRDNIFSFIGCFFSRYSFFVDGLNKNNEFANIRGYVKLDKNYCWAKNREEDRGNMTV